MSLATITNVIFTAIWALPRVDETHGGCHFAIVIASLVVVSFKFKSLVATVVVVAFVVAFDEPVKPFGSFVVTLLSFSCLIIVLPSLPQEVQLQRSKFNRRGASSSTSSHRGASSTMEVHVQRRICSSNAVVYVSK